MAWDRFHGFSDDGAHVFGDSETGATIKATGPAAEQHKQLLAFRSGEQDQRTADAGNGADGSARNDEPAEQAPNVPPVRSDAGGAGGAPAVAPEQSFISKVHDIVASPPSGGGGAGGSSGGTAAPQAPKGTGELKMTSSPGATAQQGSGNPGYDLAERLAMAQATQGAGGTMRVPGGKFQTGEQVVSHGAMSPKQQANIETGMAEQSVAGLDKQRAEGDLAANIDATQHGVESMFEGSLRDAREKGDAESLRIRSEIERRVHDLDNEKVDPNRWWGSRSTGQKVAAYIKAIFGGFAGQKDPLDFIHQAISDDVNVQIANRDHKKGQLAQMHQVYELAQQYTGSKQKGLEMTKAVASVRIAKQMQAMALRSGSALAIARADEYAATARLDMDRFIGGEEEKRQAQVTKQFAVTQDRIVGGGPSLKQREDAAARGGKYHTEATPQLKDSAQQMRVNGVDYVLPPFTSPAEGAALRTQVDAISSAEQKLAMLDEQQQKFGAGFIQTKEGRTLVRAVLSANSAANHEGVTHEDEVNDGMSTLMGMHSEAARTALQRTLSGTSETLVKNRAVGVVTPQGVKPLR